MLDKSLSETPAGLWKVTFKSVYRSVKLLPVCQFIKEDFCEKKKMPAQSVSLFMHSKGTNFAR